MSRSKTYVREFFVCRYDTLDEDGQPTVKLACVRELTELPPLSKVSVPLMRLIARDPKDARRMFTKLEPKYWAD